MPAKSEAQRKFLYAKFGKGWAKRHHFNNRGKLPARVAQESGMSAREMFHREHLTEGRDDTASLPLGKAGHAYAGITSKDVMDQPGGTSNKWRKNVALRKEVTNQTHVSNSKGATVFPSMDKAGAVRSAIKETSAARLVTQLLQVL